MTKWEYMVLYVWTDSNGFLRVKKIDTAEITNWQTEGPLVVEHLKPLGLEGWELAGVDSGRLYFKRAL